MISTSSSIDENGLRRDLAPRSMPFGFHTIAALADSLAGETTALIDSENTLSYDDLRVAVRAASSALSTMGLCPGDRLAASCYNHNALIIAFLASQRLGLIWVGVNRVLAPAEKVGQLNDCGARVLIADPVTADQVAQEHHRLPALTRILTSGPDLSTEWSAIVSSNFGNDAHCPLVEATAPSAISYTSGTTGLPKGAVHSQHNVMTFINGGLGSGRGGQWEPGLRRSVTIALTILNGMTYGPLTALAGGGAFVSMDRIDSEGVAGWIARAGIEVLCCTPPTVRDLLQKPEVQSHDISALRFVMAGGAAGSAELRELFKSRIGSELIDEYGLTEAPSGIAGSRFDTLPPLGSVGWVYPHVEVAALDSDGQPQAPGTVGEIALRARQSGPWAHVFTGTLGYWNQPAETEAALSRGWLRTGDLGVISANEELSIVGRLKELIIRGGANVYPSEVERVLRTLPAVEDAVVVGMPDARLGEIVCAFIKLHDTADEQNGLVDRLVNDCATVLARYKVPERWYVVDDIPRNAMNKPNRERLMKAPRREAQRS